MQSLAAALAAGSVALGDLPVLDASGLIRSREFETGIGPANRPTCFRPTTGGMREWVLETSSPARISQPTICSACLGPGGSDTHFTASSLSPADMRFTLDMIPPGAAYVCIPWFAHNVCVDLAPCKQLDFAVITPEGGRALTVRG